MTAPRDRSIYRIAWTMLNDEFQPGGDDYKGVSKDIHNAALEAGWRLLDADQMALLFGPAKPIKTFVCSHPDCTLDEEHIHLPPGMSVGEAIAQALEPDFVSLPTPEG